MSSWTPGDKGVSKVGRLQGIPVTLPKDFGLFFLLQIVQIDRSTSHVIQYIHYFIAIRTEFELGERKLFFAFFEGNRLGGLGDLPAFDVAFVTAAVKLFPFLHHRLKGLVHDVQKSTFYTSVDTGKVKQIGNRRTTVFFADEIPHGLTCQTGKIIGKTFKTFVAPTEQNVAQFVVALHIPGLSGVGHQAFFEPVGQIEHHRVLDNLLDVCAKKHGIQVYCGDTFAHLLAQVLVVAIKIYEDGGTRYLGLVVAADE